MTYSNRSLVKSLLKTNIILLFCFSLMFLGLFTCRTTFLIDFIGDDFGTVTFGNFSVHSYPFSHFLISSNFLH